MNSCNNFLSSNHQKNKLNKLKEENALEFSELLTKLEVHEVVKEKSIRDRYYTTYLTILMFLSQIFDADQSLQTAVLRVIASYTKMGKKPPSANTSAYSQARSKLCENDLANLNRKVAKEVASSVLPEQLWRGHRIKFVDGSTLDMSDTPENQKAYPQSSHQKEGVGFPTIRIVIVVDYVTGAVLDSAMKPAYGGELTGEHALLRDLMYLFSSDDVMIADRYYPSFFLMAHLFKHQISGVFPQHGSRKTDFDKGKRLGSCDHLAEWKKPIKPNWMSEEEYEAFPEFITVREVEVTIKRPGFRDKKKIMVTTFLDPTTVKETDLTELYVYRWFIEQTYYALKETMQMGILRGKTPAMVKKEIWGYLLGYNLIRRVMMKAAHQQGKHTTQLSFKLALRAVHIFFQEGLMKEDDHFIELIKIITYKRVNNRPNRSEPRCVKRRPKRFPRLQKHRRLYKNAA